MSYIGTEPKDIRSFGRTKFDYTATQGQTAFTGADDDGKVLAFTTGQINVYVNGILMDDSDFTTTGTGTVTLASAANLNDIISIVSFESNIPDNDYVPASGGTFTGAVTHTGAFTSQGIDDNANATAITIDSSENVGIGGSPNAKLDVRGGIRLGTTIADVADGGRPILYASDGSGSHTSHALVIQARDGAGSEIDFVTGTTPTTRMHIDSSGKVGIGTNSPATKLDVDGGANSDHATFSGTAGRGLKVSTFSVGAADEGVDFNAQASGSTQALSFSTGGTERIRIKSDGVLVVGGTSDIRGNSQTGCSVEPQGRIYMSRGTGTGGFSHLAFYNGNGLVGTIQSSGSATSYNTSSDYRLKENVTNVTDGITRVKQLAPKRFNFIADADTTVDGFLAHEAQAVVPEAVTGTHNEVDEDGNAVMQGIDQSKLVPLLTAALQEAIAKIETLETKVAALEAG